MKMGFCAFALVLGLTFGALNADETVDEVVRVRALEIDLLATDPESSPVADFSPTDLEIRLKGEPVLFRLTSASDAAPAETSNSDLRLTIQIGSEERVATSSTVPPRRYLFFIDLSADHRGKPGAAAEPLVEFVRETLRPFDLGAVAVYNGNLSFETGFASGAAEIESAIRRAYSRSKTPGLATPQRIRSLMNSLERCDVQLAPGQELTEEQARMERASTFGSMFVDSRCARNIASFFVEQGINRAESYYGALGTAIEVAGGVEGMTMIALSGGVSLAPDSEFAEVAKSIMGLSQLNEIRSSLQGGDRARDAMLRATRLAERERVRIYAVDSLRQTGGVQGVRQASLSMDNASPFELASQLPRGPLTELAETTVGGFVRNEDLLAGLRQIHELDRGRYQVLAYVPEEFDDVDVSDLKLTTQRDGVRLAYNRVPQGRSTDEEITTQLILGEPRALETSTQDPLNIYLPFTVGALPRDLDYELISAGRSANLTLYVRVDTAEGSRVEAALAYHRSHWPERGPF